MRLSHNHFISYYISALFLMLIHNSALALVIDFDNINIAKIGYSAIPANYKGLSWSPEFFVVSDSYYSELYGNTYGSPSGKNAAFNGYGVLTVSVSDNKPFTFKGASFAGWGYSNTVNPTYSATSITVEGYNQGQIVGSKTMGLSSSKYQWLKANLQGVDQLRFTSSHDGGWWLIDDLTLKESPTRTIPESQSPVHTVRISKLTITNTQEGGDIEQDTTAGIDLTAPTYVVTHGWQRDAKYSDPGWDFESRSRQGTLDATLAAIKTRFLEEGLAPNGEPLKANVILAEWEGAYTGGEVLGGDVDEGARLARTNADYAGLLLGKALSDTLGKKYNKDLHFIGHSYGTVVNGLAARYLEDSGWFKGKSSFLKDKQTVQFTTLDAPTQKPYFAPNLTRYWFTTNLPSHVDYFDNYFGTDQLILGAFGETLVGASLDQQVDYNHADVWSEFYIDLIVNGPDADTNPWGRDTGSFAHNFKDWQTPVLGTIPTGAKIARIEYPAKDLWDANTKFLSLFLAEPATVESFVFFECGGFIRKLFADHSCKEPVTLFSFEGLALIEQSPVAFSQTIDIPADAKFLTYEWLIASGGDGDWFSLFFDDTLLWNMGIDALLEGIVHTAAIDISRFAGMSGELIFSLNSVGDANAEMYIRDLAFLVAPSQVPEPATLALLALGLVGLGVVRRRKS